MKNRPISIAILCLGTFPTLHAQQLPHNPTNINFSYAGYGAGSPIPHIPAVLAVHPTGNDDTALLQSALDRIATLPLQNGFHGALLLAPGRYHIKGQLTLRASGVILRGSSPQNTILIAEGIDRRPLIEIGATANPPLDPPHSVQDDAPAGSQSLTLNSIDNLSPGDHVVIRRPSTPEWISAIGMTNLPGTYANQRLDWKPGSHDLVWDRTITSIDAATHRVQLDAPITTALEKQYGGGTLTRISNNPSPINIGIEDITLESAYNHTLPKDEDHSWIAIQLDHVEDAWVRRITARHFVSSAVRVNWRGRRITLEDCHSEAPISETAGYRRQSFLIDGQQVLVHRCTSESGMNDFASGLLAAGPNVFLDCTATNSLGASGAFEGWASGILYERVHVPGSRLQMTLDFSRAQGAGWTAANSILWNSTAQTTDALGPPDAPNFVIHSPQSLYETQLHARTHQYPPTTRTTTTEIPEKLPQFRASDIKSQPSTTQTIRPVELINGRFVQENRTLWGPSQSESWWRGDTSPYTAEQSTGSSVTRFMPGVTTPGETEDLAAFAARLKSLNIVSMTVMPGLWYEHRRDSHTIERRNDADAWAPFDEMPWARSGQGTAWDGLSRFDLSRYNPWYFQRQREFAQQAATQGLLVFYDLYNTHNVLEIGPHWIDYAWRPANNINDTGLPEPPPFKPHNRNDIGNEFFSTTYAPLRALHRAYILHTFDELADQPNVVFGLAYQYAGPLEFQQFFMDVAREWEAKHGKPIRIVLTTSKQTTDAILADPIRSKQVAVIDMRYWEYRPDATLFAPKAGENHAFRELIANQFPGYSDTPPITTPEQMYRQTREYHDKFPNIALMPMENGAGPIPLLMAGAASQSALVSRPPAPPPNTRNTTTQRPTSHISPDEVIDHFVQTYLAQDLMKMSPQDNWTSTPEKTWVLAGDATTPVLLYSLSGKSITLTHNLPAQYYKATWFNPITGSSQPAEQASNTVYTKPDATPWLLLLQPQ